MKRESFKSLSKTIAQIAVMAALLIIGKFALQFVPNIEVVTTFVMVFAYVFGYKTIFATLVFCAIDTILYPLSLDVTVSYFIYWNLLAAVTAAARKLGAESLVVYLVIGLVMTFFFGVLTSFFYYLFFSVSFWAVYAAGLVFYVLHMFSTFVFLTVGFRPLTSTLNKFCT